MGYSIAGCDFSLTAPAIVIETDKEILSKCFLRCDLPILKKLNNTEMSFVDVHNRKENVLEDVDNLTDQIIQYFIDFRVSLVNIEGYSYGSQGASYIQLIQYQSVLRHKLFKNNIEVCVVSPKSVKCAAGKGNLTKIEMFDSFCELILGDGINYEFQNYCRNNKESIYLYTKRKKTNITELTGIKKPFEDIIDAFYCLKSGKDGNKGY